MMPRHSYTTKSWRSLAHGGRPHRGKGPKQRLQVLDIRGICVRDVARKRGHDLNPLGQDGIRFGPTWRVTSGKMPTVVLHKGKGGEHVVPAQGNATSSSCSI